MQGTGAVYNSPLEKAKLAFLLVSQKSTTRVIISNTSLKVTIFPLNQDKFKQGRKFKLWYLTDKEIRKLLYVGINYANVCAVQHISVNISLGAIFA